MLTTLINVYVIIGLFMYVVSIYVRKKVLVYTPPVRVSEVVVALFFILMWLPILLIPFRGNKIEWYFKKLQELSKTKDFKIWLDKHKYYNIVRRYLIHIYQRWINASNLDEILKYISTDDNICG